MSRHNLPTLLQKGSLYSNDKEKQKELNEFVPIEYILNWFQKKMHNTGIENRVLILKSETASGKSTILPPKIYERFIRNNDSDGGLVCTQPRILTAIENVNEIMKYNQRLFKLGSNIGWSTQSNKYTMKSFGVLSVTIGTLTQQLKIMEDEDIIQKYKFILIDETHERSLQTDMAIYMIKNLLNRQKDNADCPFVVLMSATLDQNKFLSYFGLGDDNFIWCRGQSFGFDEKWDWNDGRIVNNFIHTSTTIVERIIDENPKDHPSKADILIFLPGNMEMRELSRSLRKLNQKNATNNKPTFSIILIDRHAVKDQTYEYKKLIAIPVHEQTFKFQGKIYRPRRRVILSTKVAETGLTLSNLKYVVDTGYNREVEFNPVYNVNSLLSRPATRSRIEQRRGRVGRKFRGVFYPLYPKYIYDKLPQDQLPQISFDDISNIALDIIYEQLRDKFYKGHKRIYFKSKDIDMLDKPTPDNLINCIDKLYSIGYISFDAPDWNPNMLNEDKLLLSKDSNEKTNNVSKIDDNRKKLSITKLGMLSHLFNIIDPESSRMILAAYSWQASILDMITIAAYLMTDQRDFRNSTNQINWKSIYVKGLKIYSKESEIYKIRLILADDFIDGLILFGAIKSILEYKKTDEGYNDLIDWCDENNINYNGVMTFIENRDYIIENLIEERFDLFKYEHNSLLLAERKDFMNVVIRIKYCIYDGYRNNLLIRNSKYEYKTPKGLLVDKPKIFWNKMYSHKMEIIPQYILYKSLSLKENKKRKIYTVKATQICTLDGFVSCDTDFTI